MKFLRAVLTVTLFLLKINSLPRVLPPSTNYSLYVDDTHISDASCNISICERRLQLSINKKVRWANENGFRFSTEKTVVVCFSRNRGIYPDPALQLSGVPLPVRTEHRFLGILVDQKLTFMPHLKPINLKCQRALNILKVLSHKTWGQMQNVFSVYTGP